jgi:hypothetical protein
MTRTLQRLLFLLAAVLVAADLVWAVAGRFQVDLPGYGRIAALTAALVAGGLFYQHKRREPAIAAMLLGAGFLCAFSAGASMLNYFLLTAHGPRSDAWLAGADRALGFDWAAVMTAMTHHPLANRALYFTYGIVLPEIALMTVALAWAGKADKVYRFCLAVAAGALITIFVWALMPSFGAFSVYAAPAGLSLALDHVYAQELVALLRDGPGRISPGDIKGLIGFPSYHGVLALIVAWYGREIPRLFWPLLGVNLLVLVATPVQGGHHLVDVLAAFPVSALSLFIAARAVPSAEARKPSRMVNKKPRFTIRPVPQAFFRISATQKPEATASAIKSKLSGAP